MSKLTLAEQIAVMQAALEGKTIQCRSSSEDAWMTIQNPVWSWASNSYRIKPAKQMTIPWEAILPKFKWAAADKNGDIYIYVQEPECKPVDSVWNTNEDYERVSNVLIVKRGDKAWDESLIQRPE